jgi:hypothetical protein
MYSIVLQPYQDILNFILAHLHVYPISCKVCSGLEYLLIVLNGIPREGLQAENMLHF